mmetsp:Transcript_22804/g.55375  ORF Transcript_22804/g.55375 Transcript_22804/m.55375 type:complete len:628 (-) Transcript_22804:343-2226(-)
MDPAKTHEPAGQQGPSGRSSQAGSALELIENKDHRASSAFLHKQEEFIINPKDKIEGIDLQWADLVVDIPATGKTGDQKKRRILDHANGKMEKGKMSCIMGPSGSGKTTLMTTLAGRQSLPWHGVVTADGEEIDPVDFRSNIAFVMQEEALYPTQTPREALTFSAKMRLPGNLSEQKRDVLVERILNDLDLDSCADSLIGNELIRGISGGEKRRVSIGVELITNPKILFLDEPTSGLDSSSAYSVVLTLKRLCKRGCSVISTIHQPSSETFHIFDKCFILVSGQVIFGGAIPKLSRLLDKLGLSCPPMYNLADHIMFIVKQKGEKGQQDIQGIREEWHRIAPKPIAESKSPSAPLKTSSFTVSYETSSGFFSQMATLLRRDFNNLIRDKATLGFRFGATIFLNVLFGVVFLGVGTDDVIESRYGGLLMIAINAMFSTSQPQLTSFVVERAAFLREYHVGTYGITPYFLSKFITEAFVSIFQTLLALVCSVFSMQLQGEFYALWGAVYLLALVAQSQSTLIGCVVTNVKDAMELMPLAFVPQLLFSGFFVRINQIPVWLRWVQWICSLKYAINILLLVEFSEENEENDRLLEATDVQRDQGWFYVGMLLVLVVVFRIGALISLRALAR